MNALRIYLAAPLFTPQEREFNLSLAQKLEAFSSVFLPQRDGTLLAERVESGVSLEIAERQVFERDVAAMLEADMIVAVLDGDRIDEGVAFELGYMHALGKRAVGFQSGTHRQLPTGNNPMISQGLEAVFADTEALVAYLRTKAGQG